jgi:hypothetical protein
MAVAQAPEIRRAQWTGLPRDAQICPYTHFENRPMGLSR